MTDSNPSASSGSPDPSNIPPVAPVEQAGGATENEAKSAPAGVTATPGWERATLEQLAMAAITEQRQARRWRNGIRLGWLVFLSTVEVPEAPGLGLLVFLRIKISLTSNFTGT